MSVWQGWSGRASAVAPALLLVAAVLVVAQFGSGAFAQTSPPTAAARNFPAVAGHPITQVVADFETSQPGAAQAQATITWGDGGPTSPGTIAAIGDTNADGRPNYEVSGTHTYAAAGTYTFAVAVATQPPINVQGTATVTASPPPNAQLDVSFSIYPSRTLLAGSPAIFTPAATVTPADLGPLKLSWSFGDAGGPPATDADLANPAGGDIGTGTQDCCEPATHVFAPLIGDSPITKQVDSAQLRGTYLVRLRATDRFGRFKTVARTVAVMPNTPPIAELQWFRLLEPGKLEYDSPVEYTEPVLLSSRSHDPDATNKTYDNIEKEEWDLDGDGTFETVRIYGFIESFNPFLARLGARPQLSQLVLPYPVPSPYPIKGSDVTPNPPGGPPPVIGPSPVTGSASAVSPGVLAFSRNAANAYVLRNEVRSAGADGPRNSFPRKVSLRVTDRSGATGAITKTIPMRRRVAPKTDFFLRNAAPSTKTDDPSQTLFDPVFADDPEYSGNGTILNFDLTRTTPDPKGQILYYVLEIGQPWQTAPKSCVYLGQPGQPKLPTVQPVEEKPGPPPESTAQSLRARAAATPVGLAPAGHANQIECRQGDFGVHKVIKTLVIRKANQAALTIPKPGVWSLMLSAFDETGAIGKVRYDGLEVDSKKGQCANVGRTFGNTKDTQIGFAGTCVDTDADKGLYWTANPINLSGLTLKPPNGKLVVVDWSDKQNVAVCVKAKAGQCGAGEGPLAIVVDEQTLGEIPGDKQGKALGHVGGGATVNASSTFRYKGLPATGDVIATLTNDSSSKLHFEARLPKVLGHATAEVDLQGHNEGKKVVLKKVTSARARARSARGRRGRAAVSAPAPPTITAANPLDLGGLKLPGGLKFKYVPARGTFEASAKDVEVLESKADVLIVLRDGDFEVARGSVKPPGGGIPIGATGVFITRLDFQIKAEPNVVLTAGVHLTSAGSLLGGDGKLVMEFDPWHVGISGTVKLLDLLQFGEASIDVHPGAFSFAGKTGYDWGPASFSANVKGVFGFNGAFNVEGSGKACLFACLGIKGLISSKGVAGCGSIDIDLLLDTITIEAGFGYLWGADVDVMVGSCSLKPYRVVVGTKASAAGLRAGDLTTVLNPGDTAPIPLDHEVDGMAIVAKAAPGTEGATPRVTLIGPGAQPVQVSTVSQLGAVQNLPNPKVLVDQDTVAGHTRFLLERPAVGTWTLRVDAGSPPVTSVQWSEAEKPITKDSVKGKVTDVPKPTKKVLFGTVNRSFYGAKVAAKAALAAASPPADAVVVKGISPTVETANVTPEFPTKRLDFAATVAPGDLITFVETGPRTNAIVATVQVPAKGTGALAGSLDFVAQREPDGGNHHIAAYIANRDGLLRGVIPAIATFPGPKPTLEPPDLASFRQKSTVVVVIGKGPPPPGPQPAYHLVATTSSGKTIVHGVTADDFKLVTVPSAKASRARASTTKRWAIVLRDIPRHDSVTVRLYGKRPPGSKEKLRVKKVTVQAEHRRRAHRRG